jgi:hypothetical protein
MSTLKQLTFQAQEIANEIIQADGELSTELESKLDLNAEQLSQKVDAYVFVLDRIEIEAQTWEKHLADCNAVLKRLDAAKERLRTSLTQATATSPLHRLEGDYARITVSETKGQVKYDPITLPAAYTRIVEKVEVDKDKIRQAINGGLTVPGAWIEPGFSLRITKGPRKLK